MAKEGIKITNENDFFIFITYKEHELFVVVQLDNETSSRENLSRSLNLDKSNQPI